jgi:hypothetical protein
VDKLIPIEITGAKITTLVIHFTDGDQVPEWSAEVALLLPNKSQLTSIWVKTNDWPEERQAEKSTQFIMLAADLQKEIQTLVNQHINRFQRKLEAPPCES